MVNVAMNGSRNTNDGMSRYMAPIELPTVHVQGGPRAMGQAQGEALRDTITRFVRQRQAAARAYLMERKIPSDAFVATGARCMAIAAKWDPNGHAEHLGIAEAAGVDATLLYATTNMTDIRDVIAYGAGVDDLPAADQEGCSTLLVPASRTTTGNMIAGQTWDLNPQDVAFVVAVHRTPDDGPETWSVTCAGCLSLMGMNEHGLALGTNNIKIRPVRDGVGYLSLLHRTMRCRDRAEAAAVLKAAPRSAAHVYWFADPQGADEHECSADESVTRSLDDDPLCRSNHCLSPEHVKREAEEPLSSSYARRARMTTRLDRRGLDVDAIRSIFASREDGVDSISRWPEDEQGSATNACLITEPATRTVWACAGPAQRGAWQQLRFGR
jgi:isopenicillin-N N-acyltransferase-like protein